MEWFVTKAEFEFIEDRAQSSVEVRGRCLARGMQVEFDSQVKLAEGILSHRIRIESWQARIESRICSAGNCGYVEAWKSVWPG